MSEKKWDEAKAIAKVLKDKLCHVQDERRWYIYSDSRQVWLPENRSGSTFLVADAIEASSGLSPTWREVTAVTSLLKSLLAKTTADFDADPYLLAVRGGQAVDLRTGAVQELLPSHLVTKVAGAKYVPGAEAEVEARMLEICTVVENGRERPDHALADFLRRRAGYAAVGAGREHLVFIDHGPTGTAKTWVRDGEAEALGDYATTVGISTFTKRKDPTTRYSTAKLLGRRLVTATELSEDQQLDDSLVKQMTGEEMEARHPGGRPFEFRPTCAVRITTNHLPRIGGDQAVLKRLCVVPMMKQFAKNLELEAWVKSDQGKEAFLAWIVKGAVEYTRNVEENRDGLRIPPRVGDYTRRYGAAEDTFTQFFTETFTPIPGESVLSTDARAAYEGWCRRNGEKPVGNRAFGARMEAKGHPSDPKQQPRRYPGLRLDARWEVNLGEEHLRSGRE